MSSGTYTLILSLGSVVPLSFGSNWTKVGNAWILGARAGCVDAGVYNASIEFSFVGGTNWQLAGDVVGTFAFAGLPAGFTPTSALGVCSVVLNNGSGLCTFTVQMGGETFAADATSANIFTGQSALDLNNDNIIITGHTQNNCGDNVSINPLGTNITISGTWTAFAFTWDFPQDGEEIDIQDDPLVTITSGTDPLTDLNLEELTIAMGSCPIEIVTQTPTLLVFRVPASCSGDGTLDVVATGNGVQFSGSVTLGTLDILLTNASGIYKLTMGKRNDTLYSSARDGSTYNVKIPNPKAKTGFIGG